ncbi:YceD family protein [Spongiibacter sp.]|uniref:YceD family protein n=1 Tax=Spongiibacter sp. TaxID=2024860 RepID=UPI0035678476
MQRQPLPKQLDARKLCVSAAEISAIVSVSELPRFASGLASDVGEVLADIQLYRDEQGFYRIDGKASAAVNVSCERCLQPMPIEVVAEFALAIVWTEEQAKALPKSLDPVILGEELLELDELLQDELIVSTPFVNYHDKSDCKTAAPVDYPAPEGAGSEEKGDSPFSVLGSLKPRD